MKASGKNPNKNIFSLKHKKDASIPTISVLFLLLITVALAGVVAVFFFTGGLQSVNFQPLMAKVTLESCEGGLCNCGPLSEQASFEQNKIILVHDGGSSLPLNGISITLSAYGNAYQGIVGHGGHFLYGNIQIVYENLNPERKNAVYAARNDATLKDGLWSVGENLILYGRDGSGATSSSVKVSVDGNSGTSNNYGFKAGSEITVKVIDLKSKNVLAERKAIVKHANG
jgi:FlaG/FlaF family flagellin (archaellin)